MSFEKYFNFYEDYENGVTVRPGKTAEFSFKQEAKKDKKYRLFTVGETATYYLWKNEPDTPQLYRLLSDALDSDVPRGEATEEGVGVDEPLRADCP